MILLALWFAGLLLACPPLPDLPVIYRQPMPDPLAVFIHAGQVGECVLRITVDAEGVPQIVERLDCNDDMYAKTTVAILRWRWAPLPEWTSCAQILKVVTYTGPVEEVVAPIHPDVLKLMALDPMAPVFSSYRPGPGEAPVEEVRGRPWVDRPHFPYPTDAPAGVGDVRCKVEVTVDPQGYPYSVEPVDCEAVFAAEVGRLLTWLGRFKPYRRTPRWVSFPLVINFYSD